MPRANTTLHVAVTAQRFETPAVGSILRAARTFRDVRELAGPQLDDDFADVLRGGGDGRRAWVAAERAIAFPASVVVVERDGRDRFAFDVLPDVELGPVEQRMHADVGPRREVGLVLIPELGRLLLDLPNVRLVARREVALLRTASFLVRPRADDDAGVRLEVRVPDIFLLRVIELVSWPF